MSLVQKEVTNKRIVHLFKHLMNGGATDSRQQLIAFANKAVPGHDMGESTVRLVQKAMVIGIKEPLPLDQLKEKVSGASTRILDSHIQAHMEKIAKRTFKSAQSEYDKVLEHLDKKGDEKGSCPQGMKGILKELSIAMKTYKYGKLEAFVEADGDLSVVLTPANPDPLPAFTIES